MAGEHSSGIKFKVGDAINGYRIESVFEPGAFAMAGRARMVAGGREVFFKKYKHPGSASPWYRGFVEYQNRLKERIQSTASTKNLCYEFIEFFEVTAPDPRSKLRAFYQVFEWVSGGGDLRKTIDALSRDAAAYDWQQRVIFARVLLASVNALHKAGVIHTDLKPENVFLIPDASIGAKYRLRVIDMDFSLLDGMQAPWHGHYGYVGTPQYMSPEHLREEVPVRASDVFTTALILSELLTGRHPAASASGAYNARAIDGSLDPIRITTPIADVADLGFLNAVINSALRPEPSRRPTAEQLLLAFNGRLVEFEGRRPSTTGESSSLAPPPVTPASAPKKKPVVTPSLTPATAAGVVLCGPGDKRLTVTLPTTLGGTHFRSWDPDFARCMTTEQFRVSRNTAGLWQLEHCASATNATTIDGAGLAGPVTITDGLVIGIGKSMRCPITLRFITDA